VDCLRTPEETSESLGLLVILGPVNSSANRILRKIRFVAGLPAAIFRPEFCLLAGSRSRGDLKTFDRGRLTP
jgi:hypothetical protein